MERVSEAEVQALQREVNTLKQEISALKKKLSENAYLHLLQTRNASMVKPYVPNVPSNDELEGISSVVLSQILSVNEDLNGITFTDIHKLKISCEEYRLEAECRTLNLLFHLTCILKSDSDNSITVQDSKVTFQDPSLVEEIIQFINSCQREKNLQELLSGLTQYSTLCSVREEVVNWLCNDCASTLHTKYSVEAGVYAVEMYGNQNCELYLTCNWSIHWSKKRHLMGPFFKISVHRDGLPLERQKYIELVCEEPPCDIEGMKEAWKEILEGVEKLV